MAPEPDVKRVFAYIDGQNLFHSARAAFGYTYPNYDVQKLAQAVCAGAGPSGKSISIPVFLPRGRIQAGTRSGKTSCRAWVAAE